MASKPRVEVGIIGGTGIGDRFQAYPAEPLHIPTEYGVQRGRRIEIDGLSILLVSRHSAGHKVPPHLVNYRAMAQAMRWLGVATCFSTAAVGSLRLDWGPGTLVVCSDFLDVTARNLTLFDRTVEHRDFTRPFGTAGRSAILAAADDLGESLAHEGVYLCANGPRYETPREIALYRKFGADLVGMTAASEAIVMREAEVDYACLAIVTNLASGISSTPLSHEEVVEEMQRSGDRAVRLLLKAAERFR